MLLLISHAKFSNFNDRSHHRTSNSRECMGVNGEALQLHAVHTKKPYFLLQVTRESVLQSNRLTVQTDENYRKSYLHTRVRTIALLKVWSDITTEALQKYAINTYVASADTNRKAIQSSPHSHAVRSAARIKVHGSQKCIALKLDVRSPEWST